MFGWRRTAHDQVEIIDELRATIAAQKAEIDQLTRTVAVLRLVAKSILQRNRPGIETR